MDLAKELDETRERAATARAVAGHRALEAADLAAERQAFLVAAAHELRAPVQAIVASLQTLERAAARGIEAPADTLPRAMRQATRLGRLINATLADLTCGPTAPELELEVFDLAALVRATVDDYRLAAPGRTIALRGPGSGVVLRSDRDRVDRILFTLLDNALRYSPRERAVTVALSLSPARSGAVVAVSDRGIGIPAAELPNVFGKFYRASNAASQASGLGLGLFLARGLAERLHGTLAVTSEEGSGSTFRLTLPLLDGAPGD